MQSLTHTRRISVREMVRSIVESLKGDSDFEDDAIESIVEAAEERLIAWYKSIEYLPFAVYPLIADPLDLALAFCAAHDHRVTIMPKDVALCQATPMQLLRTDEL